MSRGVKSSGELGLALLESSLAAVALLPVFLSAFVVVQSIGLSLRLSEMLDHALRSDRTIPLRFPREESEFVTLEVDRNGIGRSIGTLVGQLQAALLNDSTNLSSERYRIEATVGLVVIDSRSGEADLRGIEFHSRAAGTLGVDSSDIEKTDPHSAIAALAGAAAGGVNRSLAAREVPGEGHGYGEIAAILHLRIFRDADRELTRDLRKAIGLSPYVSATQLAVVRTEVEL